MPRKNRIIAGMIGGMAGGVVMAFALYATSKIDLSHLPLVKNISDETDQFTFIGTRSDYDEDRETLGKSILASAMLGGIYGVIRSTFRLPAFLLGPAYGMTSYTLNWVGLGPMTKTTPGPWNNQASALFPRLVVHTVYGMVADRISERVENALE